MMRRLAMLAFCAGTTATSCGAGYLPPAHYSVLADNTSQDLFDDAIRWSRANHLETGGCFSVFSVAGKNIVVTDAVEQVHWRRRMKVQLDCPSSGGVWHTHHLKRGPDTVDCNMNDAMDRWLGDYSHSALIVICGEGRDSVILYSSAPPDSLLAFRYEHTGGGYAPPDTDTYDCKHESPASKARPRIRCTP